MRSEQHAEASAPKVVAVEDNPADVRLVEEGVEALGEDIDLDVYNSGRQAVERLSAIDSDAPEMHPDLVLLDLNLPGKSGVEVLKSIRTETPFQEVPVIVVSSSENETDIKRVYESSANAYVIKPSDPDEYIQAVAAAIDFWVLKVTRVPTDD